MSADIVSTSFSFGGGTATLDADQNFYMNHGQSGEWKLTGVRIIASNTVSGSSNKFTLAVSDGSTAVCTSFDSEVTNLSPGTASSLTMTGTAGTAREYGPTDTVKFAYDETGTLTLTLQVICAWQKVRG
tara:strand:+ start:512 stop:898 length:387 start_codon:yes stop_codon:yes gene_type:complete